RAKARLAKGDPRRLGPQSKDELPRPCRRKNGGKRNHRRPRCRAPESDGAIRLLRRESGLSHQPRAPLRCSPRYAHVPRGWRETHGGEACPCRGRSNRRRALGSWPRESQMLNDEVGDPVCVVEMKGGKRVFFGLRPVGGYADDFRKVSAQRFARRGSIPAYFDLGKCFAFEAFDQHEIARTEIGADLLEWQLWLVAKLAHQSEAAR